MSPIQAYTHEAHQSFKSYSTIAQISAMGNSFAILGFFFKLSSQEACQAGLINSNFTGLILPRDELESLCHATFAACIKQYSHHGQLKASSASSSVMSILLQKHSVI
jgi:hypothetical protein